MNDIQTLMRSANPVPDAKQEFTDGDVKALLTLTMTRSGEMDVKEIMTPAEPDRKRNGWFVAAAAFGAVIIVAGLAFALVATGNSGDDITPAGVDDNPAVTTQPPMTTATPTTTQPEAAATATTTQPATTTTTLPFIRAGTYSVPDEVAPGTYRHRSSVARLDENMELLENYLVADSLTRNPMTGIVIVQPTDSFIVVEAWIILVEDFGGPNDPIAKGLFNGVYLVGYDIEPGRYEVHPKDGGRPYWARFDDEMEIIDSETGDGPLEVIVEAGDFAFEFLGFLRQIP